MRYPHIWFFFWKVIDACLFIKLFSQLGNHRIGNIIVVFHYTVDDAVRSQLDDAVGNRLDELVVMAGEQDIALECLQRIIEGLDGFQIQVVGRRVQYDAVGVGEHHT